MLTGRITKTALTVSLSQSIDTGSLRATCDCFPRWFYHYMRAHLISCVARQVAELEPRSAPVICLSRSKLDKTFYAVLSI